RVVFAIQREPLFVVGAGSYLDEMLRAAGAVNAGAALGGPYPRAGLEWLIAAAPELILDASGDPQDAARSWARWPALPAAPAGRVVALPARELPLPGPWIDRELERLAAAIHGPLDLAGAPRGASAGDAPCGRSPRGAPPPSSARSPRRSRPPSPARPPPGPAASARAACAPASPAR